MSELLSDRQLKRLHIAAEIITNHENDEIAADTVRALDELIEWRQRAEWRPTDLYIKDNENNGQIHKIGTDRHDSLYVDETGKVQYTNLQNGDGSRYGGYEFVRTDCGEVIESPEEDT